MVTHAQLPIPKSTETLAELYKYTIYIHTYKFNTHYLIKNYLLTYLIGLL